MSKLIACVVMTLAVIGSAQAQTGTTQFEVARDVREAERKALVAQNLPMDDATAAKFWPLYNAYRDKQGEVDAKVFTTITRYAENYGTLTDAIAKDLLDEAIALNKRQAALRNEHVDDVSTVLNPLLTLRYFQIDMLLDARQRDVLTRQLPLAVPEGTLADPR